LTFLLLLGYGTVGAAVARAAMTSSGRQVIGCDMHDDLEAPLVVDAISMAITRRRPRTGLVHHSVRGSQYTRSRWVARSETRRSWPAWAPRATRGTMPRRRAASRRSKNELVKRRAFATRDQARLALFRYIEAFRLEMLSPDEYERR
jgi:transposase InsO family protein